MRKALAGLLLLAGLLPAEGWGYSKRESSMTVFTLQQYCTELLKSAYSIDYNPQSVEHVQGFISGFYDTSNYFLSPRAPDYCVPPDISVKDTCITFNAWMLRHQNDDEVLYASPALVASLKEAFPCKD